MIDLTSALVLVGLLSIFCQYLAYRIKLPAILPLLVIGILVGPVTGVIDADQIFGDLLFPVVSLSVAIILFEGSLTLRFGDLGGHGSMVRNLCTSGAIVTWCLVAAITHLIIGISWEMAFLFGAIVTVTGPTVIVPMLRTVRPSTKLSNILRWEGIIIDPIGALLAVLVYEYIISTQDALSHTLWAFGKTVGIGLVIGAIMGYLLGIALRSNLIPHYLRNTAVLTLMLGAFAGSNMMAHESGLLTVTIMGMWLANMRDVDVDDVLEFKETLSVLLISGLFILLASRIQLDSILSLGWGAVFIILAILFIVRPVSVVISALGTGLNWREQAFLSWVAPRGIVAAAVSALFSLKLEILEYEQIELLVPLVFLVIITTVVFQSLTSVHVAQWLGIRAPKPNGYLIFGGGAFCRMFAKELLANDIKVCVADTNWDAIRSARMDNIPTYFGNPMSEHASRTLDFTLFGRVLVMSPYRQLNPMVTFHFEGEMGKGTVLGLSNNEQQQRPSHQISESYAKKLGLFADGITYGKLASWVAKGAKIKTTRLTENFSMKDYLEEYEGNLLVLCAFDSNDKLRMFTNKKTLEPKADWRIMSLIIPKQTELDAVSNPKEVKKIEEK